MILKAVISHFETYVRDAEAEEEGEPTLRSLEVKAANGTEIQNVSKMRFLLDGRASHNVYYRAEIPPGAVQKEVELAHGTKVGYVKDGDITFLDETVTNEQAKTPSILSLGARFKMELKCNGQKKVQH